MTHNSDDYLECWLHQITQICTITRTVVAVLRVQNA